MKISAQEIALQNNTDVIGHVTAKAELVRKECVAAGATFYMLPAVPSANEYANVYEYERSMAFAAYSDTHKDVYGYRPRGDFSGWTLRQIEAECIAMADIMDKTMTDSDWEAAADTLDENWSKWEKMAHDAGFEV